MKTTLLTSILLLGASQASADTYRVYSGSSAAAFAAANYDRVYGSGSGQNPFGNYSGNSGGNCTNFVSQAILGGLLGTTSVSNAYSHRYGFDIDAGGGSYEWYWRSGSDRGPAFTGASKLYEYADYNKSTYRGLHFSHVTHDTPTTFMAYRDVRVGDIVFADWQGNGSIDHSMIVTRIQRWRLGYNEIRLTYQGASGVVGKTNIGLGDLNEDYLYQALFYVYRPLDYNPQGI